jgi:glyoxylase-like metal-dependent hydrolase (beta-lactamase superfamily II)
LSRSIPALPAGLLEEKLDRARIVRIEQPMPFGPESVNLYLGFGPPAFLIDTGLPSGGGWDVGKVLAEHGLQSGRLGHVFLTHAHVDHAGSARRLQRDFGAKVWAHPGEAPRLDGRQSIFLEKHLPVLLKRFGLDRPVIEKFMAGINGPVESYRRQVLGGFEFLEPGQKLPIAGIDLRVVHTPGHSKGGVCFIEKTTGLLFSGDTLLPQGHPRAIISPDGEDSVPFQGIAELEDSLASLEKHAPRVTLGGHGPAAAFADTLALARSALAAKPEDVLKALKPGATVFDLVRDKAAGPPVSLFMHLGETRSILEFLMAKGQADLEIRGEVEYFYPTRTRGATESS